MIVKFKIFKEGVEVTPNNTSGQAGDTSSTRNQDGFMVSGNDGGAGIQFTPKGVDDKSKSYKSKKAKKKFFRKNKRRNVYDKDKKI